MGSLAQEHYEALAAVERRQQGSWEVINTPDAEYCVERGLMRFVDRRYYELTEEGRTTLRQWTNDHRQGGH